MKVDVITHYDLLVDEGNDPVCDPEPLKQYMDKWDGKPFIDALRLDKSKSVLEIGVGTGRLAVKTAPLCKCFTGIDISPKTIGRAKQNLKAFKNALFVCEDFLTYDFKEKFDLVYSSLTWLHIKDKQSAIDKVAELLKDNGRFVLSINKDAADTIDYGKWQIEIFPDNPDEIKLFFKLSGLTLIDMIETEFAYILIAENNKCTV